MSHVLCSQESKKELPQTSEKSNNHPIYHQNHSSVDTTALKHTKTNMKFTFIYGHKCLSFCPLSRFIYLDFASVTRFRLSDLSNNQKLLKTQDQNSEL